MESTCTVMASSCMLRSYKNAAAGCDLKCALLLLFGALNVIAVADDLQPEKPCRNGKGPEEKEAAHKPETRQLHGRGARRNDTGTSCAESCLHF